MSFILPVEAREEDVLGAAWVDPFTVSVAWGGADFDVVMDNRLEVSP
jgi:hypothetical protein